MGGYGGSVGQPLESCVGTNNARRLLTLGDIEEAATPSNPNGLIVLRAELLRLTSKSGNRFLLARIGQKVNENGVIFR
jgi:hypothetical protein